uniref:Ankyrin repeat protein n=1 Tax=Pithovirus LCPAC403 TaxID=2506596 RepID=A0A481ZB70_9VIRU|nr:MAG: hypothetical protein LCPAC403_03120 [Pithovirus LCPAC403]
MSQPKEDLNEAIKVCDRGRIEELIQAHHITIWTSHIYSALNSGGYDFAKFMMKYVSVHHKPECKNKLAIKLLDKDDYSPLEEAIEHGLATLSTFLFDVVAGRDLDLLKHFLGLVKPCTEFGHKLSKDKMRKLCRCAWVSAEAASYAAKNGRKDILLYLKEIGSPMDFRTIFAVIVKDNLAMFKLMQEHFPDYVKFDYMARYRWNSVYPSTFRCFKYFYASGEGPTYAVYDSAINYEPNNHELHDWLKEIKCPGTFEVYEVPKDFENRIKYHLNPGDFPWLLKLLKDVEMPEVKIDNGILATSLLGNSLSIIDILPEFVMYEPLWESGCYTKLFNFIGLTVPNSRTIGVIFDVILKLPLDRCNTMINELHLNNHAFASLYLRVVDEDDYQELGAIIKEMRKKVNWKYVFLNDLNNWAKCEGSFYAYEMINEVDRLWEKYENVIPEFEDESNKAKWKDICDEEDPWKDDIREFLYDIIF